MRFRAIELIVVACVCASGCAHRSATGGSSQPQAALTPQVAPTASIEVHGVVHLAHATAVKQCYIGKPGASMLSGYSVTFGGDDVIEGGEVLVPEFTGDGTYVESVSKRQGRPRALSWVILNVAQGPGFPHGTTLEESLDSAATITIAQGGKVGQVTFEHYRSLYGRNGDELGGDASGSITWQCATITRAAQ